MVSFYTIPYTNLFYRGLSAAIQKDPAESILLRPAFIICASPIS